MAQGGKSLWKVYLVRCADGTLYCGVTTDAARRVAMHNGLLPGGARYTRSRRPVELAALSPAMEKRAAYRIEAAVKRLPAARKIGALEELGLDRGPLREYASHSAEKTE